MILFRLKRIRVCHVADGHAESFRLSYDEQDVVRLRSAATLPQ